MSNQQVSPENKLLEKKLHRKHAGASKQVGDKQNMLAVPKTEEKH
jgi:hypothetical protein